MPVTRDDLELVAETPGAILVRDSGVDEDDAEMDVNQWWVPRSVIDETDLEEVGDVGSVAVRTWFAKKIEWDD